MDPQIPVLDVADDSNGTELGHNNVQEGSHPGSIGLPGAQEPKMTDQDGIAALSGTLINSRQNDGLVRKRFGPCSFPGLPLIGDDTSSDPGTDSGIDDHSRPASIAGAGIVNKKLMLRPTQVFRGREYENTLKLLCTPDYTKPTSAFTFPADIKTDNQNHLQQLALIVSKISGNSPNPKVPDVVIMRVAHIDAWNCFWLWTCNKEVDMAKHLSLLAAMGACLGSLISSGYLTVANPAVQEVVVAGIPIDGHVGYYRTSVLSISVETSQASVFLLDQGSIREVPLQYLYKAPAQVTNMPPSVRRCKMRQLDYGFTPYDKSSFERDFSRELDVPPGDLKGCFLSDQDDFTDVRLDGGENGYDIGGILNSLGYQRPLLNLGVRLGVNSVRREPYLVRLSAVHSPSVLYCWVEDEAEVRRQIRKISDALKKKFADTKPLETTIPEPKAYVAVEHENKWYRAHVVAVDYDHTCSVFFLDFGCIGVCDFSIIHPLDQEHLDLFPMALKCVDTEVVEAGLETAENVQDAVEAVLNRFIGGMITINVINVVRSGDIVNEKYVEEDYAEVVVEVCSKHLKEELADQVEKRKCRVLPTDAGDVCN